MIRLAQKPILYHNQCLWTKRSNEKFNIAISAFDSAEACELVGILLLWRLRFLFHINNTAIYRDVGEILQWKTSPRIIDRSRKEVIKLSKGHELKITTTNAKVINFHDMTLNLNTDNYKPYEIKLKWN